MKLIFVIGIYFLLSGCAAQEVKVENIKSDSSVEISLPQDGMIAILLPNIERQKKHHVTLGVRQ